MLQHFRMGDLLEIPSPAGIVRLPIVGIIRDYTNQSGTIFIDYSVYLRNWNDPAVDMFRVYLKPGIDAESVKERILERFAGQRRLFVFLNAEVRARIMKNTEMWLGLTYMPVAIRHSRGGSWHRQYAIGVDYGSPPRVWNPSRRGRAPHAGPRLGMV